MLARCSTLSSPRHRLRSDSSTQFPICHFQLPSMNTQRLDLPCSFHRKNAQQSQPIRPVGLSVEKPTEAKGSCSIRQKFCLSPSITTAQTVLLEGRKEIEEGFWEKEKKRLKRLAEKSSSDESCINRAKRKRSSCSAMEPVDSSEGENLSISQLGGENFSLPQMVEVPRSMPVVAGIDPPSTDSKKEERFDVAPRDVILPPVPLLSNPLVVSVVNEITDKGDNEAGTSQEPSKAKSGSSTSSDSLGLTPRPDEISSENETGNGSQIPYQSEGARPIAGDEDVQLEQHQGFELLSLVVACVESISLKDTAAITHFLSRLGELASPEGTPIHRVTAYFTEALALRAGRLWPHIFHITTPREIDRADEEMGTSLRLLNQMSPIPKFLHFTSNELLLRAFEGKDRLHIIDFDIKQGLQWPGLFQSLASRSNPPSHVRLTGIGESKQELQETGERLEGFAAALNLPFKFHAVVDRLEDVRLWMLHVKENESVAVNCILQLHKLLYDNSGGTLRDFLGLIQSTNPSIVIVAEQEGMHDSSSLETRVSNSLKYYSAIFDSIDYSLPLDSPLRIKIEEMFAKEIRNIVACEGSDRIERHESFERWRELLEHGGFKCMGTGEREMLQSQMLLRMYSCDKYSVQKKGEDGAGLTLSWLEQPLYTVSAWTPVDVAGTSSSLSQPI